MSTRRSEIKVEVDPSRLRPIDADLQIPDTSKFMAHTGWKPEIRFEQTMTRLLSNMAAQVKQAVETATLKVEIDKTFSGNTLNRGRYA